MDMGNTHYEITKISYKRNHGQVVFHVSSASSLDEEEVIGLIREDYELGDDFPVSVVLSEIQPEAKLLELNEDNIISLLMELSPSLSSIQSSVSIRIEENTVYFDCENEPIKRTIDRILTPDSFKGRFLRGDSLQIITKSLNICDFRESLSEKEGSLTTALQSEMKVQPAVLKDEEKDSIPYIYGKDKFDAITPLIDCKPSTIITVEGDLFEIDTKGIKNNQELVSMYLTDYSSSIPVKLFLKESQKEDFHTHIKKNSHVLISGKYEFDSYSKSNTLTARSLKIIEKVSIEDDCPDKRVELHLHSNMSLMDGIHPIEDYIKQAKKWGHRAIGITDHNVVQAYPKAMEAGKKNDIKVLYGVELDMVEDMGKILTHESFIQSEDTFIVFDLETTGLSPIHSAITEIGAVKIVGDKIVDNFSTFVNPGHPIPPKISELTQITDEMVKNAPSMEEALIAFDDFIGDGILVAHNASFDSNFIEYYRNSNHPHPVIDTLLLSQNLEQNVKNYKLGNLAKHYGIKLSQAHRAVYDAQATAELFLILMRRARARGIQSVYDLNSLHLYDPKRLFPHPITVYAKNKKGIFDLYKIISQNHVQNFYRTPRTYKSQLLKHRENFLLGTSTYKGELVDGILSGFSEEKIGEILRNYDFIEIQPPIRYRPLLQREVLQSEEEIKWLIEKLLYYGEKFDKVVVATGDVHYLYPHEEISHDILIVANTFDRRGAKSAHFYSTQEMLDAFSFLGAEKAYEIVVTNTNQLADWMEELTPIPEGKFPPKIENSEDILRNQTYERAREIYGEPLPEMVQNRLETELDSIITNGYSVMYNIAAQLVKKSNDDGYYVGSRGSVGSSLVATMMGITEVNPLAPHYYCTECNYSDFITSGAYSSGIDLPDKYCPSCGSKLQKEGHLIPFEVFLGFYGDKEPDIDLNFAGEYQGRAHKYIEDNFGKEYVYRAGTIGTLAEKTAYALVKEYCEKMEIYFNPTEITRLAKSIEGVKRTSGQHPGGIMIVPRENDIHEFTPIQYPADDSKKNVITTHFDYHAISENILKLDILGHDAPSILRMLEDFTHTKIEDIPLDDSKVMSLFLHADALNLDTEIFDCSLGTLGIPEFGTNFVMKMLRETKPKTFADLVNISGLSHGTDVWSGNAQDLVLSNTATISEVISTREDIMNYLIQAGAENKMAFDVMESVRKGRGIPESYAEELSKLTLPSWYMDSCKKIQYMFPKAHAVAYVTTSVRIAWYKIYHPAAFYAAFFTMKLADIDGNVLAGGPEAIKKKIREYESMENISKKDKDAWVNFTIALEMEARGFHFDRVTIGKSSDSQFLVEENRVILPFQSLPGVGEKVAIKIVEESKKTPFLSKEDFIIRTGASKTVMEALEAHGTLEGLAQRNQLSMHDFFG